MPRATKCRKHIMCHTIYCLKLLWSSPKFQRRGKGHRDTIKESWFFFLQLITCVWWQNAVSESRFCVQIISPAFPAVPPTLPQLSICHQPPAVSDILMTTQVGFKTLPSHLYYIFDPQHFFHCDTEIKVSGREKRWHIFQGNWIFPVRGENT